MIHQSARYKFILLGLFFLIFQLAITKAQAQDMHPIVTGPIVTRCLEESPCEKIPRGLIELDRKTRETLALTPDSQLKKSIEFFTETKVGKTLLAIALSVLSLWRWGPANAWIRLRRKRFYAVLLLGVLGSGVGNEISDLLKRFFGRLKPHVNFVHPNPDIWPALSLPSNHAFNTAFLMTFLWIFSRCAPSKTGTQDALFHTLLLSFALAMALSRILVGEHYPLDVSLGLCLGFLWAELYHFLLSKLWPNIFPRHKVS